MEKHSQYKLGGEEYFFLIVVGKKNVTDHKRRWKCLKLAELERVLLFLMCCARYSTQSRARHSGRQQTVLVAEGLLGLL